AIIPAPFYFLYPGEVAMAGGEVKYVETSAANGFKITAAELEANITARTRLLFLNTPLNPVGSVYSEAELKELAVVLETHAQVVIICDEIYERLVLDTSHASLWVVAPALRDRILTFNSFSKPSGLSGLRIGWMQGPADIMAAVKRMKASMSYNTNTLAQVALREALSSQDLFDREMDILRDRLRAGRNILFDRLTDMGFSIPAAPAGMFLFPQVPESLQIPRLAIEEQTELTRAEQFAHWLIPFAVTVAPGVDMGVNDRFRILFALEEQSIEEGMDRIQRALASV
ncbi:MAG: aminotransferase class I/II-fold pyridoxal phosphate-dependent enzyme, partial [Candidatus Margulisiibacteriota bacterium]